MVPNDVIVMYHSSIKDMELIIFKNIFVIAGFYIFGLLDTFNLMCTDPLYAVAFSALILCALLLKIKIYVYFCGAVFYFFANKAVDIINYNELKYIGSSFLISLLATYVIYHVTIKIMFYEEYDRIIRIVGTYIVLLITIYIKLTFYNINSNAELCIIFLVITILCIFTLKYAKSDQLRDVWINYSSGFRMYIDEKDSNAIVIITTIMYCSLNIFLLK